MTKDQFWETIDEANSKSLHMDQESRQSMMTEALVKYTLEDILDWYLIFTAYRQIADRNDLWNVCTRLGAQDTEDGFSSFRSWLISQGKEVYMNAVWDPRTLDSAPHEGEQLNSKLLVGAAVYAYDAKLLLVDPNSSETLFEALAARELDPQTIKDIRAEIPRQKHSGPDRLGRMFRIAFGAGEKISEPQTIEELADTLDVAYGCVSEGGQYTQYVFHNTPENIAKFIGSHPQASKISVTDAMDWPMLNTVGTLIDECPDEDLLEQVKKVLIPIQQGEAEAQPFFCPTLDELEEYQSQKNSMNMGF